MPGKGLEKGDTPIVATVFGGPIDGNDELGGP